MLLLLKSLSLKLTLLLILVRNLLVLDLELILVEPPLSDSLQHFLGLCVLLEIQRVGRGEGV